MRLAVPGHPAAELLVKVGNRAGAGLEHAAAHHHPVGIEAMHVHVARGPALEVRAIFARVRPAFHDPGAGEIGEIVALGDPHAPPFEDRAVPGRADEADRLRQAH